MLIIHADLDPQLHLIARVSAPVCLSLATLIPLTCPALQYETCMQGLSLALLLTK